MKIQKITNILKTLKKTRQDLVNKRKIAEQERLIEVLKRPEGYRRKPAMKFASNRKTNFTGPR